MPKFKTNDTVRVNGRTMTLLSWPADDNGPFLAKYVNQEGGDVFETLYAGQLDVSLEPVQGVAAVELIESGGPVVSTAGDVASLAAEAQAEADAIVAEAAATASGKL